MTIQDKLLHFQKTTMESARAKSNAMIDDYTQTLEQLYETHKEERERQADMKIQAEESRLRLESNRQLHLEQLQIRQKLSDHNKDLKNRLFTEVSNQLEEYMKTPAYLRWLTSRIQKAKAFAGDDEILFFVDAMDASLIHSLQNLTHTEIQVSEEPFFGGIRAILPKKQILIDDSFQTKLEEEKAAFTFGGNS